MTMDQTLLGVDTSSRHRRFGTEQREILQRVLDATAQPLLQPLLPQHVRSVQGATTLQQ
jgi:hypothetical protein